MDEQQRHCRRFFISYETNWGKAVATVDASSYDHALNLLMSHYSSLASPSNKAFCGFRNMDLLEVVEIPETIVNIRYGPEFGPDVES